MAEKGSLIIDQAGGKSIATRDALELDDLSNARVIQRFSLITDNVPSLLGSPTRLDLYDVDGSLISGFPSELESNLITCGDKSKLVVFPRFNGVPISSEWARVTALCYDNEVSPGYTGFISAQRSYVHSHSGVFINDGTYTYGPAMKWDLVGSPRVGLHFSEKYFDVVTGVSLFGFVY